MSASSDGALVAHSAYRSPSICLLSAMLRTRSERLTTSSLTIPGRRTGKRDGWVGREAEGGGPVTTRRVRAGKMQLGVGPEADRALGVNYLPVFGEVGRVCGRVGPGFLA